MVYDPDMGHEAKLMMFSSTDAVQLGLAGHAEHLPRSATLSNYAVPPVRYPHPVSSTLKKPEEEI